MKRHGGHHGISASTQQDLSVKRTRAVGPPMRTLPCPDCKAGIGEPCVSRSGKPQPNVHRVRRHQVMQAYWDSVEESGKMSV